MTPMTWDPQKFDVHVQEMNRQHHRLIGTMNRSSTATARTQASPVYRES